MNFDDIIYKINNLQRGCYFIYGEEIYFINEILNNVYNNDKITSNSIYTYYGEDCDMMSILNDVYQQSIFDDFNIIVVKNAENNKFLNSKNNVEYIKKYISKFTANAILLFVYNKNLTKTSELLKIFDDDFIFNSKKLIQSQIKSYIKNYCKNNKKEINDDDIDLLYECYGDNLSQIMNEIEKGFNKENIKYSRQFNSFEFLNALITKNARKVSLIVNNFDKSDQYEIIPFLGLLFSYFSKLLAYIHSNNKQSYPYIYQLGEKNFSKEKILKIIDEISSCHECIKGINSYVFDYNKTIKYFSAVILN